MQCAAIVVISSGYREGGTPGTQNCSDIYLTSYVNALNAKQQHWPTSILGIPDPLGLGIPPWGHATAVPSQGPRSISICAECLRFYMVITLLKSCKRWRPYEKLAFFIFTPLGIPGACVICLLGLSAQPVAWRVSAFHEPPWAVSIEPVPWHMHVLFLVLLAGNERVDSMR